VAAAHLGNDNWIWDCRDESAKGCSVSPLFLPLTALLVLSCAACATKPPASDPDALAEYREVNDPLEPTNRFFYRITDKLDTYLLRPVAVAYRDTVPERARRSVHNLLVNLSTPAQFANDVLQAKPRKAGDSMMRFVINSTAGVGGLFDVATDLGYPDHENDFGKTLALWGVVDGGPYLFLPVIGPSNPRDATGYGMQTVLDPFTWASFGGQTALDLSRLGVGLVDTRTRLIDQVDSIKRGALDSYATFRSLYRQNRADEINKAREDRPHTVPAWFARPAAAR
jgi:phospholipid-binding lipoprotein MlaA